MTRPKIAILGAGISGLALASRLAERYDVTVVEAESSVGGMARTIRRGPFYLNLGPHPLYASSPLNEPVIQAVRQKLGNRMFEFERRSAIYFNRKLWQYPLRMRDILTKLSFPEHFVYSASYLKARILFSLGKKGRDSFADWVKSRYGSKIYQLYFEKYTAKAWGMNPEFLSSSFAAERVPDVSLAEALWETILGKKPSSAKDHPHNPQKARSYFARHGVGTISDNLKNEAISQGARFLLNCRAVGLKVESDRVAGVRVEQNGSPSLLSCDYVASSIPLSHLVGFLSSSETSGRIAQALPYSGLVFVFLFFKKARLLSHNWIYFPEPDIPFNRIFEIKNCSQDCAPSDQTSLCVEFPAASSDSERLAADRDYVGAAVKTLSGLGVIEAGDLTDSLMIRHPHVYGLWLKGFESAREEARGIVGRYVNLASFGRQGEFQYYNMDHCLKRAESIADRVHHHFEQAGG